MDLKEIRNISKKMLANFVDEIGLDGEFYASTCNCPMAWRRLGVPGKFIAPGSEELERIIQSSKYDEKTKRILNEKGLILINQEYRQKEADPDLIVTAIHETIHSNRNLLLFDTVRDGKNENSYSFNNGKFEQNTTDYNFSYADASQEVLKGNIDSSKEIINSYEDFTSEELDDMQFKEGKRDSKIEQQQIIDEALVELMAAVSYKLYTDKENGKSIDIWKVLEKARDNYEGEDIGVICKIILKHQDFELFNWMLDPITYSQEDIHYDFFEKYTKYDQDLVQELYECESLDIDDILGISETNEIPIEDIKEVATSQTAIEELLNSFRDISNAQNREENENQRE